MTFVNGLGNYSLSKLFADLCAAVFEESVEVIVPNPERVDIDKVTVHRLRQFLVSVFELAHVIGRCAISNPKFLGESI